MTKEREEAINEIKQIQCFDKPFDNSVEECNKFAKREIALNMAIEALEQEPCEDAISRKVLLSKAWFVTGDDFPIEGLEYITKGMVENMPSVTPQPKIGHWTLTIEDWNKWICSECGFTKRTDIHVRLGYNYCPNCGARMEKNDIGN